MKVCNNAGKSLPLRGYEQLTCFSFVDYLGMVNECFIGLSICKTNILSFLFVEIVIKV